MGRLQVVCIRNGFNLSSKAGDPDILIISGEDTTDLIVGKVYDVLSIEGGWYRVVDETFEDYLYPPDLFEVIE